MLKDKATSRWSKRLIQGVKDIYILTKPLYMLRNIKGTESNDQKITCICPAGHSLTYLEHCWWAPVFHMPSRNEFNCNMKSRSNCYLSDTPLCTDFHAYLMNCLLQQALGTLFDLVLSVSAKSCHFGNDWQCMVWSDACSVVCHCGNHPWMK